MEKHELKYDTAPDVAASERGVVETPDKFKRLGWKRLTVILIVEAIALGTLSIPSTFAKLGMVAGVILTVGLGLIAIYTSYVIGQVKLRYPGIGTYADAGRVMFGRFGYELVNVMLVLQLVFLVGSHCLTGTIAWTSITGAENVCAVVWGVISAVLLFGLALPPAFAEVAVLGYVDFVSIIAAVLITIIGTGVEAHNGPGLSNINWSAWPAPDLSFADAFIAVTNVIFAYSFAMCQFPFMDEMHTPEDFPKAIWTLGLIEIFIYTITGALVYAFVGSDVQSPALLSAGHTLSRVAFGIALPVIFISGAINGTVLGRMLINRFFAHSPIRFVSSRSGWLVWTGIVAALTIAAFIIAEVIPFFSDLLSIMSALFVSGFSYYFPGIMWFMLVKEGPWYTRHNLMVGAANLLCIIIGIVTLGAGTYASVQDIINEYAAGTVSGVFACKR